MDEKLQQFAAAVGEQRVKWHEPMAAHTNFKVGGPADIYVEAETVDDLILAVQTAIHLHLPYFVFGGGSNILVADAGIRGVTIKNKTKSVKISGFKGKHVNGELVREEVYVEADAGVAMNYVVRYTIQESLQGLEVFLGLPGSVGGAVWNNSHFRQPYNEFVGNFVHSAKIIDEHGVIAEVDASYFRFAYDYSSLHDNHAILLSVVFKVLPGNKEQLWEIASKTSVQKRHDEQPLELPSAGCTFQNISKAEAEKIHTPNGLQSAGYLLDQAGMKGKQVGQAKVSEKHANFIVNLGGATATDIKTLLEQMRQAVHERFGVTLHEEIVLVGEW